MEYNPITVSELNQYIKDKIGRDEYLNNVFIKGEISNFKHHYTGHMYFTLKDDKSLIKCIMFKSYTANLNFVPKDGLKVMILGTVSVFERDGTYQLYAKAIKQLGKMGDLRAEYEELKAKLEKELDALSEQGHSGVIQAGRSVINSVKGEATVRVNILQGGSIALNIDDYSVVKKMTIKNESNYGELYFNYVTKSQKYGKQIIGNNISVSGKELEISQAIKAFEYPINKGYKLFWGVTDDLYKSIGNDLNFDLTQIKDTITFTVEFNDGKIQTASLNLYFDSDGYMHIG